MTERADIVIIGAGAAGLMAAIFAGRASDGSKRILALDRAPKIGAKILISGGGRCNVTHDVVTSDSFFGGSQNIIGKVLRSFNVDETVAFFEELGVTLKREEGGKLFPVTDRARTVLDALLAAGHSAGVETFPSSFVASVAIASDGFLLTTDAGPLSAGRIILATGGRSVPKTGSDGSGYELARSLGHSLTTTTPALVPLLLPRGHWLTSLSGIAVEVELILESDSGKRLRVERGPLLFTHFGLSGPAVMDMSRHWIAATRENLPVILRANLAPGRSSESIDGEMLEEAVLRPRATPLSFLERRRLPARVAEAMVAALDIDRQSLLSQMPREARKTLARTICGLSLPVTSDRGFDFAEVTAGGVPLDEIDVTTMSSRLCPGLFLCGEILDVDGRIGGYNFQWAWASGRLAGRSAAR